MTKSLQTILESTKEIRVLGIGHCAKDALVLYETHRPDVLLTDIREAFSIGVKGYLIKQNLQAIIPSVKSAYNGQAVFGNEIIETFTQMMKNKPTIDSHAYASFSERELAIIKEVAAGKNNKEIADALYLSDGTVRNYISQLLEKLDLRDRTQLAIYFYQHLQ